MNKHTHIYIYIYMCVKILSQMTLRAFFLNKITKLLIREFSLFNNEFRRDTDLNVCGLKLKLMFTVLYIMYYIHVLMLLMIVVI